MAGICAGNLKRRWQGVHVDQRVPEGAREAPGTKERGVVEALRRGDDGVFETIVRQYSPRMLATARRMMRDEAAAQDCVQDAFLSAYSKIGEFEARSTLATWLHRITVNAALMKLRTNRRRREDPIDPLLPTFDDYGCRIGPLSPIPVSADALIEQEQVRQTVLAKIGELPDSYRIVLMLRDIEELDTQEVANMLDVSQGAVKIRLHRARSALKKLLEPLWREAAP